MSSIRRHFIPTSLSLSDLTLIMPYYENPGMLARQFEEWQKWPADARKRIRVVLIDDGSQRAPAALVVRPDGIPALEVYRVSEDRPWHQHAARNLGAHVAPDGWLLMTDMDHVLTAKNAVALLKRLPRMDGKAIFTLHRIEATTGEPTRSADGDLKPHPNSFVLTRDLYWRIGGYDEDYCGIYGTDGLFKERAFRAGRRDHLKKVALTRFWRDVIADASTNAPRKDGRVPGAKQAVKLAKIKRGEPDSVKVLDFEWERVF